MITALRNLRVLASVAFSMAGCYLVAAPVRTAYLVATLVLAFAGYTLLAALGSPLRVDTGSQVGDGGRIGIAFAVGQKSF